MSDREHALWILERIAKQKLTTYEAISREPGLDHPDFVRMLVHGVLRWQGRLDHAIGRLASRNPKRIDPLVLQILRIGALQIWFSEVPAYAAVSESTELAGKVARRAKSFVNAVMRRVAERPIETLDPSGTTPHDVAIRTSHPEWLVESWTQTYGSDRAESIATANQELSFPDLLVNTRRWTAKEALNEIRRRSLEAEESSLVANVIRLRSSTSPLTDLIRKGRLYPMDEGSVAMTSLVPDNAQTVLDLCAAPGGKSLSMTLANRAVVSCDISLSRTRTLERSLESFFDSRASCVVTDALQPGLSGAWDIVFIDAPCSATGTIRKNPEVRWRVSGDEIRSMSLLQRQILESAFALSRRYVLYVTCSLEPEENDHVVTEILERRRDFETRDLEAFTPLPLKRWLDSGVLRLTPESGADGFTATLLERVN